ncbi:MAG: DNA internalization-related competence protein ComEC/Rec2 [Gammaproteobacteria bacterium]|nr:MAG: DNA internalization-related competence protein ComEC/Rec2 [Gammaproteobacteria bacterium]RKZ71800.1 MAG: DNA internalization-related competence protein ComEC/Rec2 [Gammaproteobacteria bacterium]
MHAGTIAFLIGIVIFLQLSTLPPDWLLVFLPFILSVLFIRPKLQIFHKYILVVSCSMICGFLWALLRADIILANELDRTVESETVIITGEVVSLPDIMDSGIRFEFQIAEMKSRNGIRLENPGKVRLGWYRENVAILPGQYWRLHVRLKRPYGFSNPGGFDYEGWLFQHRIRATGYVRNKEHNELLYGASAFSINYYRYLLQSLINTSHIGEFEKGFISALSLGDRSKISAKQWQTLTQTGTSHLLAISGLHIGLVAGLFFIVGRWLWACAGPLPLQISSQRFAALAGLLGAFIYAALAGFSIPTQRALIMLSVWMLSLFFNRKYAVSDIISISLLAVLIIDPFAAMDAGFWLSFMAISIIAYGMTCRVQTNISGWRNVWWKWGRVQYLVAVGLFPLLVLWFQQYPLVGILANVIAVPYISLIVVPLVLLGIVLLPFAFPVGELVLQLAGQTLGFLWPLLEYLSSLEFNLWHSASPSPLAFVAGMIGVFILLLPKGMPARWIGIFWLLPLLLPHSESPETGDFWLAQLDVGQGLGSVVQTQAHTLIYDTGDKFSQRFNAADAVIIPYLKYQNIQRPDLLIVSHGDRDHIGGAEALLRKYPQIQVLTSIEEKIDHAKVDKCVEGKSWQWDGVDFEILSPNHSEAYQGNNSSCVLRISNDQHSILLSGDIERTVEARLIRTSSEKLSAKVLIAPHHGSKTSSSLAFIDAVAPEIVVFPVGYRNRFGFPKQDIISRYESRQVKILNTARDGALLFRFEDSEMIFSRYRYDNQRFWTSGF